MRLFPNMILSPRIGRLGIVALGLLPGMSLAQAVQPASQNITGAPIVDLGYVKYVGTTNDTAGITYFRGIQYAQAPVGELRWQKPQPIESHNNFTGQQPINATQMPPACFNSQPKSLYTDPVRGSFAATPYGESEDCLVLDVLIPSRSFLNGTSLPVMFQIHGGGYTEGGLPSYPGDAMVNQSDGNIIYVSIQYRLGLLGFLSSSEVAQDGVLNAGLLDQRAALEWVQRNIRAFGGDPNRVTIWGGSAGGGSVTYQLMAGGAFDNPPFAAAIAEYPWWQPLYNASVQERTYRTTLQLANCTSLQCLRELSTDSIGRLGQQVQNASYPSPGYGYGEFPIGPVLDGQFLRELPDQAFKMGRFYDVPLLVDHDKYEGYIFSNQSVTTVAEETADAKDVFPSAGPAFFSRLYELYPLSDFNTTFLQRQTWFGDFIIDCPTYFMASQAVNHNSNRSAVFKLTFAAGSEVHGATGPFLASNITGFPTADNQTLAEIMTSYWISFAVAHDPNPLRNGNAPFFPSYSTVLKSKEASPDAVGFTIQAVTAHAISPVHDLDASGRCEFWGNNDYVVRN